MSYTDAPLTLNRQDDETLRFVVTGATATIAVTGDPDGGTYLLRFRGRETAPIAHDATADDIEAALAGLPNVAAGEMSVTGLVVTFSGALEGIDPTELVADGGELTGGSSPNAQVAATRKDVSAWTEFWATFKTSLGDLDEDAVLQVTLTGGGIVITGAAQGEGKVVIAPTDWPATLPYHRPVTLYCDLAGLDEAGKRHRISERLVLITPGATRATS